MPYRERGGSGGYRCERSQLSASSLSDGGGWLDTGGVPLMQRNTNSNTGTHTSPAPRYMIPTPTRLLS